MSLWPKVRDELNAIVNRHFETPEYKQFFSVKLTPAREKILNLHYPHYIKSRRDCWGAAAVKAPLDVKRAIWEHAGQTYTNTTPYSAYQVKTHG